MRLLAAVAASLVLVSGCGENAAPESSQRPVFAQDQPTSAATVTQAPKVSDPTRIKIPSIGVDAPIRRVGLNPDKSMETPPGGKNLAGWFAPKVARDEPSFPRPGEIGAAVIVGHVDSKTGPDVFYRLKDLQAGAEILVTDKAGKTHRFKVTARTQTDKDELPTGQIWTNPNRPVLRLITCGGTFDRKTGHYTENVVVFADGVTS